MDTDFTAYAMDESDAACNYTARFQSVIGNGIMSIVSDIEEKKLGLSI